MSSIRLCWLRSGKRSRQTALMLTLAVVMASACALTSEQDNEFPRFNTGFIRWSSEIPRLYRTP